MVFASHPVQSNGGYIMQKEALRYAMRLNVISVLCHEWEYKPQPLAKGFFKKRVYDRSMSSPKRAWP